MLTEKGDEIILVKVHKPTLNMKNEHAYTTGFRQNAGSVSKTRCSWTFERSGRKEGRKQK